MKKHNAKIKIYQIQEDWQGGRTESLLGEFDVWHEERDIWGYAFQGVRNSSATRSDIGIIGKGVIFLYENIDVTHDCEVEIDSKRHKIVEVSSFKGRIKPQDSDAEFHHKEIVYK